MTSAEPPRASAPRLLILGACFILLTAACAKIAALAANLAAMEPLDPIMLIKRRYLLAAVAAVELAAAALLTARRSPGFKGLVMMWLGTNFILYRAALFLSGAPTPCPCLANIGTALRLSSGTVDAFAQVAIAYLMTSGAYLYLTARFCHQNSAPAPTALAAEGSGLARGSEEPVANVPTSAVP